MSCQIKVFILLVLLFYNNGAFSSQCFQLFNNVSSAGNSLILFTKELNSQPQIEFYPGAKVLAPPADELNNVLNRLGYYKKLFNKNILESQSPLWSRPIKRQYERFFINTSQSLLNSAKQYKEQNFISLKDYTELIIKMAFLGHSLESRIASLNKLSEIKPVLKNSKSKGKNIKSALADMRYFDERVEDKTLEILSEQKRIYKQSGFKLRILLTTKIPNIKTINRLKAKGYFILSVPKSSTKTDGVRMSILDHVLHDQIHLKQSANFLLSIGSNIITKLGIEKLLREYKRKSYLRKISEFNEGFFRMSRELEPLDSYLLEVLYFYMTHELGLPADKAYFKEFLKVTPAQTIVNEIYSALKTNDWGYDSVLINSKDLKSDIDQSITNFKKIF